MNVRDHNRRAWDSQVEKKNPWTKAASPEEIAEAREGRWTIVLTPNVPVPRDWLPDLPGKDVLCLASGGGQQGPVLAAAGAKVTVLDNSPGQLDRDRSTAQREGLEVATVEGDMADLGVFPDESFDFIVHPVSNVFAPDVLPVWKEAFRVLRPGGALVAGFCNPLIYLFDQQAMYDEGRLEVKHTIPYSDDEVLTADEKRRFLDEGRPLEFGHTLEDQIGGQIAAGFVIAGFFEDRDREGELSPLRSFIAGYMATKALKPRQRLVG